MKKILSTTLAALLVTGLTFAEELKSGPQKGSKSIPPFAPLHANGPEEGKRSCLVCSNGNNPVAMIFAREVSPELTALVKKIDAATAKHGDCSMGSFVVFLNDDEKLEQKLKMMAKKEGIKKTILTIDNPAGPRGYEIPKDASVTVVLYNERVVQANRAFKKGELKEKDIDLIVQEIPKILPKK